MTERPLTFDQQRLVNHRRDIMDLYFRSLGLSLGPDVPAAVYGQAFFDDLDHQRIKDREAIMLAARTIIGPGYPSDETVRYGVFELNVINKALIRQDIGLRAQFTPFQFRLFHLAVVNGGRVVSNDQFINAVASNSSMMSSATLKSHISHIRRKIGDFEECGEFHFLKNHRMLGYRLVSPPTPEEGTDNLSIDGGER